MSSVEQENLDTLLAKVNELPNLIVDPALGEIYRNLEPIVQKLNEIETGFSGLYENVTSLPNNIVTPTLEEIFRTLLPMRDDILAGQKSVAALETALVSLQKNQTELPSQINSQLSTDISTFSQQLEITNGEIHRNLGPIVRKLNEIETGFSRLYENVTSLPNNIVTPTLEEIFRTLLPMRDDILAGQKSVAALETALVSLQKNQTELPSQINSQLSTDISTFNQQLEITNNEIRQIPNHVVSPLLEELFRTLSPMKNTLDASATRLDNLCLLFDKITDLTLNLNQVSASQHRGFSHTQNAFSDLSNTINDSFTNMSVSISALPNQIVAPTLNEIFRSLTPIHENISASQTSIRSLIQRLTSLKTELSSILQYQTVQSDTLRAVHDMLLSFKSKADANLFNHDNAFRALDTAALSVQDKSTRVRRPKPLSSYYPEAFLYQIKDYKPELYDTWKMLFNAASSSYIEAPNHNCSTWTSPLAVAFKNYVKIYNKGQILDIGCGPHADPMYLQGLPSYRLSALEPLEIIGTPRFPIYRGVNEFIPFKDKSFQTVINATALDHVIDVERALEETARVLDTNGYFIIWYANVTTAPNPVTDFDGPLDDYHLFHTNDEWFLPMLAKHFHTVDRRVYAANATIDNVFAVYQKK